jgi:CRISPR-associated protein Cas5t
MIALRVKVPFGSFRKSYARSFAETYPFPPPATVYGMLLSLVGERSRGQHVGVRLAFAYARKPSIAVTLRKLSRYKYGVSSKQTKLGNAPEFIETLCGIEFLCWVDSSGESPLAAGHPALEQRLSQALMSPETVSRTGIVCLGLSDDAVDDIELLSHVDGEWRWLAPDDGGEVELPVWVDHVGSQHTRWQRFRFHSEAHRIEERPPQSQFVEISDPRPAVESN